MPKRRVTSTCASLAKEYASENSKPIPDVTASLDEKQSWLFSSEWGCVVPSAPDVFISDQAKCKELLDVKPPDGKAPVPYLNTLREDGFLHWVNQRGMQCVNRVTGRFYGLDPLTGLSKAPSATVPPPTTYCVAICANATTGTAACFECVAQAVQSDPSLCPAVDPAEAASILESASNCHYCIAAQNSPVFTRDASGVKALDEDAMAKQVWKCVVGSVHPGMARGTLIGIIALAIGLATIIITVTTWTVIHARRRSSNRNSIKTKTKSLTYPTQPDMAFE